MPRFVPRERKHKKLSRQKDNADTNVQEIIPASQVEKEAKRAALKQQLREQQPESKFSSQKRKRLEKYVDTKLRKEENAELIRKLAAQNVDTSLFQSSKTLGKRQDSKKERRRREPREYNAFSSEDEDEESDPKPIILAKSVELHTAGGEQPQSSILPARISGQISSTYGAGLKRPLDLDESGKPIIQKRKRRKLANSRASPRDAYIEEAAGSITPESNAESEEAWNGFSDENEESISEEHDVSASTSEDEEHESASSANGSSIETETPARISAFKAWGKSQLNAAVGFVPSSENTQSDIHAAIRANFKHRAPSPDPLLDSLAANPATTAFPAAAAVTIPRSEEVQKNRLELPVVQEEQKIIETIHANPVALICGATGSGKTTQVPPMLFENGYASLIGSTSASKDVRAKRMIGITQPRRVAATSVADRVTYELGSEYSNRVAHQVRYDMNVSKDTAIKFMTDGILLREIQADFALEKYSCIIIDEAHERSVNTDILIGLLSRIVPLRDELTVEQPERFCPLKLVIMSATLRINDFLQNKRLFRNVPPPVVEIDGRQYSVTEHFARSTKRDYVSATVEKVARGHRKLPPGGILVFLTGQDEISTVTKLLKEKLEGSNNGVTNIERSMWTIDDEDEDDINGTHENPFLEGEENEFEDSDSDVNDEVDDFAIEDHEIDRLQPKAALKPHVLPLYAALPAAKQQRVFQAPPDGHRQIILATNVAETSLTIPGIRYVFDCGRSKEKRYSHLSGVQTFEVGWISKASAAQRQGRAGRTGPGGHVWRLYSSAVYERDFDEYTVPEILRTPLESVVLQLKGFEIENIANFPFPTAPDTDQLVKAERLLTNLGAIDGEKISEVGTGIMAYPVNPRLGKILWLAKQNRILQHAVALVAGLAVGDLFVPEARSSQDEPGHESNGSLNDADQKRHQAYTRAQANLSRWDDQSDAIKILKAIVGHREAQSKGAESARTFCSDFWLREKGFQEVQQLRMQLHFIVKSQGSGEDLDFNVLPTEPAEKERTMLKQIVGAGFADQVAIRADKLKGGNVSFGRRPTRAIEVAYRTLVPIASEAEIDHTASPVDQEFQRSVFIHPSSVLAKKNPKDMPDYIIYSHLSQATASTVDGKRKKTRVHPLTPIGPKTLAELAEKTPLLQWGKPIGKIEELPDRRRQCWVGVFLRAPGGVGIEWPLSTWKVVQRRNKRGEWVVEKVVAR